MAKPCAAAKILDGSALYTIPARFKEREIVLERDATIIGRFRKQYVAWVPITSLSTKKVLIIFTHFFFKKNKFPPNSAIRRKILMPVINMQKYDGIKVPLILTEIQ